MKNFNEINRTPIDIGVKKNLKFNFKSIVQNKARWLLTIIAILTLGVGQMWAGTYTVVGVAMDNDYPRISLNSGGGDGCGWWTWFIDGNKAGITYEGKKLYVPNWTDCWNGVDAMYFQAHSDKTGDKQTSYNTVYTEYTGVSNYNHKIYNYDASSTSGAWYGFVSMTNGAKVYFDASNWSETNIKLVTGHAAHQKFYSMSHVANTKLYYGTNTDTWSDAVGFGVVGGSDQTGGVDQSITEVSNNADEYTGWKRQGLTSTGANNAYLCVNAGKVGQQPTVSYNDSYTTLLNSTQTIESYVSTDYGSSYSKANSKATITITSYAMTAQGASGATASNGSLSTSANSTTVTSARTATTTLSVGTVADGYVFVGWFNSSNSLLSTETSYTYYPTGATTIRARFKNEVSHTVTISNYCTTNSTTISSSSRGIGESTSVNITAPSINDHTYVNWTLGNGMTNHSANLSANPISVTTDGAGSTYTMRANYTLKTCSISVCTTSNASGDGTKYLMSYNYTENAYYYDMASSPANLYFRFVHADGGKWSGNWNGSAPNVYNVDANGDKVTCNTNVSGWDDKATLHFSGLTGSPIRIWFDFQNKKAWITETTYSVTVNDGAHGEVDPHGSVSVGKNDGKELEATPDAGWMFDNWSKTGSAVLSSTSTNPTTLTATNTGTVTANYKHRYILRGSIKADEDPAGGMAGWSATDNSSYASASISDGVMTITANLTKAKTQYKCMIRDLVSDSYKGLSTSSDIGSNSPQTLSGSSDFWFTTTCAGTYTFTYDVSKNTLKVVFPTSYTITYEVVGGTGGTMTATVSGETVGTSPGKAEAGSTVRFSASPSSGYEFTKWVDGSGSQLSTSNPYDVSSLAADKTVKAVFTAITYNSGVLKKNGGDEDGSYSVTYMATSITPSAPTKTGYHVDGYYAEAGTSTHIATAAGVLQNNKSGYTDATGHWNYAGVKDLYAKWAANTYTAENNIDGNSGSNGQYTATYDATSIAINTAPTRTGYNLTGYHAYGRGANTLANSSGTLTASQSEDRDEDAKTLTNSSKQWIYDGTDAVIYADWTPITYTIHFNGNGNTGGSMSDQTSIAYNSATTITANAFTKTGYSFAGWATSAGGSVVRADGAAHGNLTSTDGATVDLFAKWTANNYTVTLSCEGETGYGSSPDGVEGSVSATYDAAMPSMGTAPVGAAGYKFQGYFTEANGAGTQYYNADGTSAKNWDIASATTLYAYFQKAEITGLSYKASIAKDEDLVVNPTIEPAGASNYMDICWTLHYQDNDEEVDGDKWAVAAYTESDTKPNQVKFTFTDLADGLYYVKAVLKASASSGFDACSTGTELDTKKGNFRVAGNSTVVIRYQDTDGLTLREESSVEVAANATIGVKAPEIIGYTFSEWELSDVITNECESDASCGTDKDSINISASFNTFLTAKYTKKDMIYFNNANVGWDHVYVYFYDNGDYWEHVSGKGIGAQYNYAISDHSPHYYHFWGEMTQIEGTDVWYFDYQAAAATINPDNAYKINSYTHVAFTQDAQGYTDEGHIGYEFFYATKAAYRTDFDHDQSMYVPIDANTVDKNVSGDIKTVYYNTGYWTNYPNSTGYVLEIYDNTSDGALKKTLSFPFSANKAMPVSITTDLEGHKTYGFKIKDANSTAYGNTGTMSNGHSGDEGQNAPWEFKSGVSNRCGLTTTSAGDYTFTLTYGLDIAATPGYNFLVGVHYPEATGDYRIIYTDDIHTKEEVSKVIPFNLAKDTISYFVRSDKHPVLKLQKCSATYSAGVTTVTWTDTVANLISSLPSAITEDGVYYFCINKNEETGVRELGDTKPYEGNFYIRVDGAGYSGWDNFRANDHLMPYSDYSYHQTTDPYSHYFTKWYDVSGGKNKNIKFVVANDYSVHISDTVVQDGLTDDNYVTEYGWLHTRSANVRFMYNYKTNAVTRRYVDGAQGAGSDDFLKILCETANTVYVRNHANTADSAVMEVKFADKGNWLYEAKVKVKPGATYKLKSSFGVADPGVVVQYFKGGPDSYEKLVGGSGETLLEFRLLYDFKTNRLVTAYIPSGTLTEDMNIEADLMFVREHQGDIEEVKFTGGAKIKEIKTVYSVLRFNKYTLNNREKTGTHSLLSPLLSRYERDLFYVSFPYDVKVSDIIGFGTYGQHWIIEYYDGAGRAKNGFWIDSDPNWKFVTPSMKDTFQLKQGVGYLVALDLDELWWAKDDEGWHDAIWNNIEEVELLFPGEVDSISNTSVTYSLPAHYCTIERDSRKIKDSHWNIMGVPTYSNPEDDGDVTFSNTTWITDSVPKFIYAWNMTDNTVTATSAAGFRFKAMHAYMVQYCGNVTFSASANTPASVVARRNENARREVEFRLEIQQNDQMIDQTFVNLSNNENASTGFEYGEDLTKEFNANKANIYTFIADVEAAGNTLPISDQTTVVPVGVKIVADGDYTFAMPAGTSGIGVTLIDTETGIRTSLSALNYTINLTTGTYNNRFILEISPIAETPTGIEPISEQDSAIRKVMIDGIMYIIKNGEIFDARGVKVK